MAERAAVLFDREGKGGGGGWARIDDDDDDDGLHSRVFKRSWLIICRSRNTWAGRRVCVKMRQVNQNRRPQLSQNKQATIHG